MANLALLGGNKVRNKEFAPQQDFGEEEKCLVMEVIDSKVLSGFLASPGEKFMGGEKVRTLEDLFKQYYRVKHALAVNSATAGLHAAVAAINLNPGDEIIVTPYTMCASATAVVMHNAIPVFADIDEHTFNIDPKAIKECITPQTRAIIAVHLFGCPAPMDEIMRIAREHNLKVIEDAAQAPASTYKGRHIGTIGDMGVFSFNQNKTISTGEGGIVITNDDELAKRVSLVRNHGEVVVEQYPVQTIAGIIGYNYRMTELEAAVGIAQFKKLDKLTSHRIRLAEYLTKQLQQFRPVITTPLVEGHSKHVYFVYPMKFNAAQAGISRNKFAEAVRAEGLPLSAGYVRPIYWEPMYQQLLAYGDSGFPFRGPHMNKDIFYPKGLAPVCERMHMEELLTTPICRYPLTQEDIDDFVAGIRKVLNNKKEVLAEK
ncbi:MAG: DegT/DnrJ/EryC1/StrS family aminotransferase [Candidatus Omnitrophica bacterium]|nr:DegT/DnrJ/EryC1/StrS family aminotransferase [Candidatus Omnitrophota bacterium]